MGAPSLQLGPGLPDLGLEAVAGADKGGQSGEDGGVLFRIPVKLFLSFLRMVNI